MRELPLNYHFVEEQSLIALGYSVYLFANWLGHFTEQPHILGHKFYVEPLLICILASYYVTNYSTSRPEFIELLHETGPVVYVVFFTLTGASLAIDVLIDVFGVAIIFFFVRLLGTRFGRASSLLQLKNRLTYGPRCLCNLIRRVWTLGTAIEIQPRVL